jgi:hypothetical protein
MAIMYKTIKVIILGIKTIEILISNTQNVGGSEL